MLKFYENERMQFKEQFGEKLSIKETELVFSKLARHYKIRYLRLEWGRGAHASRGGGRIQMPERWASIGVLCHEFAHIVCNRKSFQGHNKVMWRVMKRIMLYCKRKGYWMIERQRRLEPKPVVVLSKEENLDLRIKKRMDDFVRFEKRLAYFTKLYNGKMKKARLSIAALERVKVRSVVVVL